MKAFPAFFLFGGSGGGAIGAQQAMGEYRGQRATFVSVGSIDCDARACEDFRNLTQSPALELDLFDREQYRAYHGKEPPRFWSEAGPEQIRAATGGVAPEWVVTSPPCQGFSGLLPKSAAGSAKYQALNYLAVRGIWLMLEAYRKDPPSIILFENVPRIVQRGPEILETIKRLLDAYGYAVQDGYHDAGQLGGLAQRRMRYFLIARNLKKTRRFVYHPPSQPLKAIGDVIGPLPLPDDPAGGPMHKLPRLKWLTWVRLALIRAGHDWHDLQNIQPGSFRLEHDPRGGVWRVAKWEQAATAITANARVGGSNCVAAVADPRVPESEGRHQNHFRVRPWDEQAGAVTGASHITGGAGVVADPRVTCSSFPNLMKVAEWDGQTGAVTASTSVSSGNGTAAVADPRYALSDSPHRHDNKYRVQSFDGPARTVVGQHEVQTGAACVADPRWDKETPRFNHVYAVHPWEGVSGAVVGGASGPGGGCPNVADVRYADIPLGCEPRGRSRGPLGVVGWDETSGSVIASGDVQAAAVACSDPRIPSDDEVLDPTPVIISLDGTRHRPMTALELARLQDFPLTMPDGSPLRFAGSSRADWIKRIGNAIPAGALQAVGEELLPVLLQGARFDLEAQGHGRKRWVHQPGDWTLQEILLALQMEALCQ